MDTLEAVRAVAKYLKANGPSDEVRREITKILDHPPGKNSPLVELHNTAPPGEHRNAIGKLLSFLGQLYRCGELVPVARDFDRNAKAELLEYLAEKALTNDAPATATSPPDVAFDRLVSAMDETQAKVVAIASDESRNADMRLRLIASLDERYYGKGATDLAKLLAVSRQAIEKTDWWRSARLSWLKRE